MIAGLLMLVLLAGIILGESNLAAFAMESKEKEKVSLSFNDKGKLFFEKERGNQACFKSGETVKVYFLKPGIAGMCLLQHFYNV